MCSRMKQRNVKKLRGMSQEVIVAYLKVLSKKCYVRVVTGETHQNMSPIGIQTW
jgi:hypothetical protein